MNQDRAVELELFGNTYHLLFTADAMFALTPPGKTFDVDVFSKTLFADTPDGLDSLCKAISILSEQGELARRNWGYDAGEFIAVEHLRQNLMPFDILAMRKAAFDAICRGLLREVPNAKKTERDKGLEKLNKKKEKKT